MNLISEEEGRELALKVSAGRYLECSAINQVGLADLFVEAVKARQESVKKSAVHSEIKLSLY